MCRDELRDSGTEAPQTVWKFVRFSALRFESLEVCRDVVPHVLVTPRQVFHELNLASGGKLVMGVKLVGACETWFMAWKNMCISKIMNAWLTSVMFLSYCHALVMFSPCSCHALVMLLSCSCHTIVMWPSSCHADVTCCQLFN